MKKGGDYNSPFEAVLKGVSDLFKKRTRIAGLKPEDRVDGKTILITGSSSGLGFATAVELAKRGGNIIMAVRSGIPEKGDEIKTLSGNENIEMRHIDLSEFESIDAFLLGLEKDQISIDIVISNAAVVNLKSRQTKSGLDEMFMVNYLAPFYLVNQLIAKKSITLNKPRIIFVASESHRNPPDFDISKLGEYHEFGLKETVSIYGYYKMLLVTYARELSRRNEDITVRALCPGPVNSNIAREAPNWMMPLLKGVFSLFFKSPAKASEPVVYFAAEPNPTKKFNYLFLMSEEPIDHKTEDKENGRQLWNKSEIILEKSGFPIN